jgi:outer membrane immunogenic protein
MRISSRYLSNCNSIYELGKSMRNLFRVGLAGLLLASSAAIAADMPVKAQRPILAVDLWTGFYVGAAVNYHDGTILDQGCVGLCVPNHRVRDTYATINAGYDYKFSNNVVLGIFGWIGVTPVKSEVTLAPGIVVKGETDFAGMIGGRIGYAVGNFLPYAFVGAERVSGNVNIAIAPIPNNKRTHTGYGAGVGLEYLILPNLSVDGRYMYSELDRQAYNFGGGITTAAENAHTVSLGVNYRFGWPR